MDLFYIKSKPILVIVDKASSHIKCFLLKNSTSKSVCEKVEDWCLLFGRPQVIRSDADPCFRTPFRDWCRDMGIRHEVYSTRNPISNGLAESGVCRAKKIIIKSDGTLNQHNIDQLLSVYNNTERAAGAGLPDQLFFKKKLNN